MNHIVAKNDISDTIQVSRNVRLRAVTELDYDNCYHLNQDISGEIQELAVQHNKKLN